MLSVFAILFTASAAAVAQFGAFDPSFDGDLFGARHEITFPGSRPAGVAFSGGTLFVADAANQTIVAYDTAGQVVAIPGAEWDTTDPDSPVSGLIPNQLTAVIVNVDGSDRNALLVSDWESNRVAAFATDGTYLFTLRLQRPTSEPTYTLAIGQTAMSAGARFNFTSSPPSLTLTGNFAAAWREQLMVGSVNSGALAFDGAASSFVMNGAEFDATPTIVLTGMESSPAAPAAQNVFGVTFDTEGRLYVLDAYNERLHVYSASFARLFTFGTPVAGGGTAEFYEPWGLAFWPDAAGTSGRLLINDTYNSRIMIYRPVDGIDADSEIDNLQFETVIANFVAPAPPIELFSIAVDPATGTIAVSDFAELYDDSVPRVVVLQKPRLAAFNLQLLDVDDQVISNLCADTPYKVRFSLTVPAGLAAVNDVAPTLTIDGAPAGGVPVPAAVYPSATLSAGEVMTFTYSLPGIGGDVKLIAAATASNTNDISGRAQTVFVARCDAETDPTSFTVTPNIPAQVSGWTPVHDGDTYTLDINAQDDDGIGVVEYEVTGASPTPGVLAATFEDQPADAIVSVPVPYEGRSTLRYRARDANGIWTAWQAFDMRTRVIFDLTTNENSPVEFRLGDPEGLGFAYSVAGLPDGVTFSSETGQFAGVVSFDAVQPYSSDPVLASGIYDVVVTEHAPGGATSSVGFTWTINHINRPPVITTQPPAGLVIKQGVPFSLQIDGFDPDDDPSVYTIRGRSPNGRELPPSITIGRYSGLISGVFPLDADASYDITVGLAECGVLTDPPCAEVLPGTRLATLVDFQVGVLDANLPADIVNPGPQVHAEGATVSLQIAASDAEGDALTYAAAGLPQGLAIDPMSGLISGTVSYSAAGPYAVIVTVDDHVNAPPRSVQFAWTITDTNRAPVTNFPARISNEGWTLSGESLAGVVSDPDGSPVTFVGASGLPPGVSITPAGAIVGSFDFDDAGVYPVTVTVSDGELTTAGSFTWTVNNVNRAPELVAANRFNTIGDVVAYQLPATDPDGDALVFSANGLPPGLTLNEATGLISGTIPSGAIGAYTVNVGVADVVPGQSLAILVTFTWTIGDNQAPVCTAAIGGEIWPPNHKKFYAAPITGIVDPDGNPITITVTGIWQDEPIDSTGDGQFSPDGRIENGAAWIRAERNGHGNKAKGNGRVYEILFTATDGKGGSCTGSVLWTVPHDQGQRATAIDDGVRYDSTGVVPGTRNKSQIHQKSARP